MEKALVERLEAAVARLELLASGSQPSISPGENAVDPALKAFDELTEKSLGRISAAAEKIGGDVLEVTKILKEAFSALRDLLVESRRRQVVLFSSVLI